MKEHQSQPRGAPTYRTLSRHDFVIAICRALDIDLHALSSEPEVLRRSLDSLQMLEAALAIEELTGLLTEEDEAAQLKTIADAYGLYVRLCERDQAMLVSPNRSQSVESAAGVLAGDE